MDEKEYKKIIKELQDKNKTFAIQILGNEEIQANAFWMMMNAQALSSHQKNVYCGITKENLKLLDRAKIEYKILSDV